MKWIKLYSLLFFVFNITTSLAQSISLTTLNTAVTQNFNTLSNIASSTTNSLTINGWYMTESGGGARDNEQYAVDDGGSNTGDTYSYGTDATTDRALGSLRTGTLVATFGAAFTNNTGNTITSIDIAYTGEQWRLGNAGRTDKLSFQYSLNATSLTTGTWTSMSSLDFITPNTTTTGSKNGNATGNFTNISATISSLSIANGATFWIRWQDEDATGSDDGLAVDDFSLTPKNSAMPVTFGPVSADIIKEQLVIKWSTFSEQDCDHFLLQVSGDGSNWKTLQTVQSKSENGYSTAELKYEYQTPLSGITPLIGLLIFGLAVGFRKDSKKNWCSKSKPLVSIYMISCYILTLVVGTFFFSCSKKEATQNVTKGNLYVRIIQVDKDGSQNKSRVVIAVENT